MNMNSALIAKHDFEIAKKNIEDFSKKLPAKPSFDKVEVDGGLFGLGNHKVTGIEMNKFIGNVQNRLIDVNSSLRSIVLEFGEVYNAFDSLDSEYITGIMEAIKGAEEASNEALSAQSDIQSTVDNLKKTVSSLVDLKSRVDEFENIINMLSTSQLTYDAISRTLNEDYKINQIPSIINSNEDLISKLNQLNGVVSTILTELNKIKGLHETIQSHNILKLEKKIKVAYYIGGSVACLLLINYLLQILRFI